MTLLVRWMREVVEVRGDHGHSARPGMLYTYGR